MSHNTMSMKHFSLRGVQRSSYEELPDAYEPPHKQRRAAGYRRCTAMALVGGFLWLVLTSTRLLPPWAVPWSTRTSTATTHTETIPTLLQIVDPVTQSYVYALDNPVYHALAQATLHQELDDEHGILEYPSLRVELHAAFENNQQRALTLSWTSGLDRDANPIVVRDEEEEDSCLVVLQCRNDSDDDRRIVEAATLPQVRATHEHTCAQTGDCGSLNDEEQQWFIPIPTALRYDECTFALYQKMMKKNRQQPDDYALLAETEPLHLSTPNLPTAIHLAWTERVDTVLVQFVTSGTGTPVAQFGIADDDAMTKVTGTTTTYVASDLCQAPANDATTPGRFQPPGSLHTVELTGLRPDTVYRYQVGLAAGQGVTWSPTYPFRSALPAGDPAEHSYLVYGDQGCLSNGGGWSEGKEWVAAATAREMNHNVRSVHHFGDLSYAQGAAHQWDQWFDMIQPFAVSVPLMVAVGNHEYDHESGGTDKDPSGVTTDSGFMPVWGNFDNDSGGECGVPTAKRFTMPNNGNSNGVFWYSFDYGLVHTIVISSEHDLSEGSRQHHWLREDLKAVDRSKTPWLVVESHRPLYEGEVKWTQNSVGVAMRVEIEDLLYDYKVDVFLAGHYHAFHRTCDGLYRSTCNDGGPIHLTIGTAGAHLDDAETDIFVNSWTAAVILQEYGYGRMTVKNASALHFEFVKAGNETDPSAGDVLDDLWILRDR